MELSSEQHIAFKSDETIHLPRAVVLTVYPEDQVSSLLVQIPYLLDRSLGCW
jgi:hypothetical protein